MIINSNGGLFCFTLLGESSHCLSWTKFALVSCWAKQSSKSLRASFNWALDFWSAFNVPTKNPKLDATLINCRSTSASFMRTLTFWIGTASFSSRVVMGKTRNPKCVWVSSNPFENGLYGFVFGQKWVCEWVRVFSLNDYGFMFESVYWLRGKSWVSVKFFPADIILIRTPVSRVRIQFLTNRTKSLAV